MKQVRVAAVMVCVGLGCAAGVRAWGQASEIPSAAPVQKMTGTDEERGRKLIAQMVEALGGQAWLDRKNMEEVGHVSRFFRGEPSGFVVDYYGYKQFAADGRAEGERIEYESDRALLPGKVKDVVQVWTPDNGYEVTYKGRTELPKDQVEDYLRRQKHSIENVVKVWLKEPGVMVVPEGTTMVERRMADKVTVLSANNDAVTLELDATTHLPLRRTFEWRNETFKDHDEDAEGYDDYHTVQGLPTPYSITRYRNGDMASQRFLSKVKYNEGLSVDMFDPNHLLKKKK